MDWVLAGNFFIYIYFFFTHMITNKKKREFHSLYEFFTQDTQDTQDSRYSIYTYNLFLLRTVKGQLGQ